MPRVTVEQIREALKLTKGGISAAARVLGIARNNLYKRLSSSNIDPNDFRGNTPEGDKVATAAHAVTGAAAGKSLGRVKPAHVSVPAIFPRGVDARSFPVMGSAANATEEPKTLRQSRSMYLRPDQVHAINEASLDLPHVLREKLSPSRILEMFIDDRFAQWLEEKLQSKVDKIDIPISAVFDHEKKDR